MDVSLEIISGPQAGETFPLRSNRQVQVGRGPDPDISVDTDPLLSELHFQFWWDESGCWIQDLQSARGTFLNGQKISQAAVRNGDKIVAGQTQFIVRVKRGSGIPAVAPVSQPRGLVIEEQERHPTTGLARPEVQTTQARDLLEILGTQPQPLFALLDAARDPKVLGILRNCDQQYQSLYEGDEGEELAEFAPYLVELPSRSALVQTLVREGWGKSWGIFLTSTSSFKEVRRHFRHFLFVQAEDGRELYFRFYDPRVLRVFLPTCTLQETSEFFGPVTGYLVEGEQASILLTFTCSRKGVEHETVSLTIPNPPPMSPAASAAAASLTAPLW